MTAGCSFNCSHGRLNASGIKIRHLLLSNFFNLSLGQACQPWSCWEQLEPFANTNRFLDQNRYRRSLGYKGK